MNTALYGSNRYMLVVLFLRQHRRCAAESAKTIANAGERFADVTMRRGVEKWHGRPAHCQALPPPVCTLAVSVPVLNEAKALRDCVDSPKHAVACAASCGNGFQLASQFSMVKPHYQSDSPVVLGRDDIMPFMCDLIHPEWGIGKVRGVIFPASQFVIRNSLTFPPDLQ